MQNKTSRLWHYAFLILGVLGLIDIATRRMLESPDVGYISLAVYSILKFLVGLNAASIVATYVSIILSFSIVWLVLAYIVKPSRAKNDARFPSSE